MESEWGKSYQAIKYDFEKILVGIAENHLMICQAKKNETQALLEKLEEAINAFSGNKGARFLIAVLNSESEDEFQYRVFLK